jgi:glycosyltransferase involved in cell wall biosynthesis
LNIGFVTTESPYSASPRGGIAAYLRAIIPAWLDAGHRVTLFAGADKERSFRAENDRLSVHHFRLPSKHWYASRVPFVRKALTLPLRQMEWSYAFYKQVAAVATQEKFDLLESTETGALFLNRIAPVVIRLHGSEFVFRKYSGSPLDISVRLNDWLERHACERASAITSPSHYQAREIAQHRGWPGDRFQVIPNPISETMLQASSQSRSLRASKAEPILLYVGRLAPVKGIEPLLKAAAEVHAQIPEATFVLVGPWQMPSPPEEYGLQLDCKSANGVLWVGAKAPGEVVEYYRAANLFVMPSYSESFGIGVLEAMAFGLPVIATRAGALPEVVRDGEMGCLVPPGDPKALAVAVTKLLNDVPAHQRMGKLGHDRVIENFTAERVFKSTFQVYTGLQDADEVEMKRIATNAKPSAYRAGA